MIATTTCAYGNPLETGAGGVLQAPTMANARFAFASSTCVTETDVHTLAGFTYGEMITGFFLFVLITMAFFGGILNRFLGVKLKKSPWNKTKILKELDDQKQDDDA